MTMKTSMTLLALGLLLLSNTSNVLAFTPEGKWVLMQNAITTGKGQHYYDTTSVKRTGSNTIKVWTMVVCDTNGSFYNEVVSILRTTDGVNNPESALYQKSNFEIDCQESKC